MKAGKIYGEFVAKDGRKFTIRALKWEDLDSLLELINSLVSERHTNPDLGIIYDKRNTRESESEWLAKYLVGIENGHLISAAAEFDGKIVANSEVRRGVMKDEENHGTLGILIAKGYRGLGLGFKLVNTLLDECAKGDIKTVELEVFANNPRAKHVYEKAGFREVGRIPKKIHRNGRFIDTIVMSCEV